MWLLATMLALAEDVAEAVPEPDGRGWAAYALPLLSYDSNLLLGYGGFGQVVIEDPTGEAPYRASVELQLYWTTGGYKNHYVRFDLPNLAGSKFRWRVESRRISWTRAPYYGVGSDRPREDGLPAAYDLYCQERWLVKTQLRYEIVNDLEVLFMADWHREVVDTYPNSRLAEDEPLGFEGGDYSWVALGVVHDTRTEEIDPYDGYALDGSVRLAHPLLGSDFQVWGVNLRARGWRRVHERVVLAGQVMGDVRFGDEPFFNQAYAGGMGYGVVGGRWILKGLAEERYRGDGMVFLMPELRWTFWTPTFRKMDMRWMAVPFVDMARIWAWGDPWTGLDPKVTGGAGLRINFKDLIVLRADFGVGFDEYAQDPTQRLDKQVYVLSEHPF
ncbi:MAG: BamA/TamA family outer membrane protein [Proteobacteria bacterium]|nr:BamA/TamA family outer membrane protein [Pseudomonadota bacterium]